MYRSWKSTLKPQLSWTYRRLGKSIAAMRRQPRRRATMAAVTGSSGQHGSRATRDHRVRCFYGERKTEREGEIIIAITDGSGVPLLDPNEWKITLRNSRFLLYTCLNFTTNEIGMHYHFIKLKILLWSSKNNSEHDKKKSTETFN